MTRVVDWSITIDTDDNIVDDIRMSENLTFSDFESSNFSHVTSIFLSVNSSELKSKANAEEIDRSQLRFKRRHRLKIERMQIMNAIVVLVSFNRLEEDTSKFEISHIQNHKLAENIMSHIDDNTSMSHTSSSSEIFDDVDDDYCSISEEDDLQRKLFK